MCSHTPHPFHVHIYYARLPALYLYRFVCVLWSAPHVFKSRLSVLAIDHLFSVLESLRLILACSSTRISHTADHRSSSTTRVCLRIVFELYRITLAYSFLSCHVFPLGQLSHTRTKPFSE